MPVYKVKITVSDTKKIEIEAASQAEAERKAREMLANGADFDDHEEYVIAYPKRDQPQIAR